MAGRRTQSSRLPAMERAGGAGGMGSLKPKVPRSSGAPSAGGTSTYLRGRPFNRPRRPASGVRGRAGSLPVMIAPGVPLMTVRDAALPDAPRPIITEALSR